MSLSFYSDLPVLRHFAELTNLQAYTPLPPDWYVVITDIADSTQAVAQGRYKEVNLLGASSIVAALNVAQAIEIPFIFGGDGATLLVPPELLPGIRQALQATQALAQSEFAMTLRLGIVPAEVLTAAGEQILVAKYQVSDHYQQVLIQGNGILQAERLIKTTAAYQIPLDPTIGLDAANYAGLECRWQNIYSKKGKIHSLLIMAKSTAIGQQNQVYAQALQQIVKIYGDNLHPIDEQSLHLAFGQPLTYETKVRAGKRGWLRQLGYFLRIQIESLLGWYFMHFQMKIGKVDWSLYKPMAAAATDARKFDGVLRMILAGTQAQLQALRDYLEVQFVSGKLVYGLQASDAGLMTCLVFERNGKQVHFLDGGNGGYTLAAKDLKERLKTQVTN